MMTRHDNPLTRLERTIPPTVTDLLAAAVLAMAILLFAALYVTGAIAAEAKDVACPNPGQPCKVLLISPEEEQLLVKQGGILDSAAAARYIELGNVVAYFRMRLMQAAQGEVIKPPAGAEPSKGGDAK